MDRPTQPAPKKKPRKALRRVLPLEGVVLQTIQLLVRTFLRCGYAADDIAEQIKVIGRQMKPLAENHPTDAGVSQDDWVQILTLWSMDPDYVESDGNPLALRLRGAAPSVEALLKRVDSRLTLQEVCNQLINTGVARRTKDRLVAIAHAPIVFPAGSPEQSSHHLQMLHSVLLNIEHNAAPADGSRWVERRAICHSFPESALATYSAATGDRAQTFLEAEDATMHRIATFTPSKGRTVRAMVQILFSASELDSSALDSTASIEGSEQKGRSKVARPRSRSRARKSRL